MLVELVVMEHMLMVRVVTSTILVVSMLVLTLDMDHMDMVVLVSGDHLDSLVVEEAAALLIFINVVDGMALYLITHTTYVLALVVNRVVMVLEDLVGMALYMSGSRIMNNLH